MDFVEKYWPSLIGLVAMIIAVPLLWPSDDGPPSGIVRGGDVEGDIEVEAEPDRSAQAPARLEDPRDRLPEGVSVSKVDLSAVEEPEHTRLIETVEAFPLEGSTEQKTYDQDDPEVKAALSEVKIELYQANECETCDEARRFFETNNLSFLSHDIDSDSFVKERMRRLSGETSAPVILIDGQVVRGFSPASVESALTAAVKRRVES
jgi:glutaredoxin